MGAKVSRADFTIPEKPRMTSAEDLDQALRRAAIEEKKTTSTISLDASHSFEVKSTKMRQCITSDHPVSKLKETGQIISFTKTPPSGGGRERRITPSVSPSMKRHKIVDKAYKRNIAKMSNPRRPVPPKTQPPKSAQVCVTPLSSTNSKPSGLRWKKGEQIGKGSYGKVYVGFDNQTGGMLAIKEITFGKNVEKLHELRNEINLMRSLRHKNVVAYTGAEVRDQTLYILTEWVPGGSLLTMLEKFTKLHVNVIRVYTKQLLDGLAYLHANNVIHRDIKCANILVDDQGIVKLADFGASKRLDPAQVRATKTDGDVSQSRDSLKEHLQKQSEVDSPLAFGAAATMIRGTPYYMAPECVTNHGDVGFAADIWSLGCSVLEMLTGNPPWKKRNFPSVHALMFFLAESGETPVQDIPQKAPHELKTFLSACFRRNPEERPSAKQLLNSEFIISLVKPDFAKEGNKTQQQTIQLQIKNRLRAQAMRDLRIRSSGGKSPSNIRHTPSPKGLINRYNSR